MKKIYVCQICGHIAFDSAPVNCPVCNAPQNQFKEDPEAIMPAEKEGKEKHIPQIIVTKECGLIPGLCHDIHIKVGTIPHPMTEDHLIQWLDVYVNKVFTAHYMFTPQTQAALSVHLKTDLSGTITVIIHCNKHGNWIAEAPL